MSWPWRSPEATRAGLRAKVANRWPAEQRSQRIREIAYRRLLLRLFETQPERWLVKGGAALLLRLDPNRTSNDIDLAYVVEAAEHTLALEALREAAQNDAGDFFEFEIGAGRVVDADHPLERAVSVPVHARVGTAGFAAFSVDLALARKDIEPDWIEVSPPLTGDPVVDTLPRIATLPFSAQLADKICATYETHGHRDTHSSRARDLADIAMIATQVDLDGDVLIERVRAEEARRLEAGTLKTPLPDSFRLAPTQAADWSRRWKKATRGAPITFDDALECAQTLVDPVLGGTARRSDWLATERSWNARSPGSNPDPAAM